MDSPTQEAGTVKDNVPRKANLEQLSRLREYSRLNVTALLQLYTVYIKKIEIL